MSIFPTNEEIIEGLKSENERLLARMSFIKSNVTEDKLFEFKELTFIEDPKGGFTGWFKEIPNVISEGETREETYHNLILTLYDIVKWKK